MQDLRSGTGHLAEEARALRGSGGGLGRGRGSGMLRAALGGRIGGRGPGLLGLRGSGAGWDAGTGGGGAAGGSLTSHLESDRKKLLAFRWGFCVLEKEEVLWLVASQKKKACRCAM